MKERNIRILDPLIDPSVEGKKDLAEINRDFVTKENLSEADIEKMAENIADSIKERLAAAKDIDPKQETEFIINILQSSQILNHLHEGGFFAESLAGSGGAIKLSWTDNHGVRQSDTVTREELEPFLKKIRIGILNKLPKFLPPGVFAGISKRMNYRLAELEGGRFHKDRMERRTPELTARENANKISAIKYLDSLPFDSRSPFIFYGTETIDKKTGETISRAINLTDIYEVLQKSHPPLQKILKYFNDIVDGHLYLLANGLILTDNHLKNIGVNRDTDRGILHDLDGLRKQTDPMHYVGGAGYVPPERGDETDSPATEANVVYELGVALGNVAESYALQLQHLKPAEAEIFAKGIAELQLLAQEMTAKKPRRRPRLLQVQEKLRAIIQI